MNNFNLQVPAVYAYSHQPSPHWQPQPVFSHYPQQQRTVVYSTPPPQGGGAVSPRVYLQQQHTVVYSTPPPQGGGAVSPRAACRCGFEKPIAVLLLYIEFILLFFELRNLSATYAKVVAQPCLEATRQGARWDRMAANLLPPSNAVGRLATYLLVSIALASASLLYFLVTLARFVARAGCASCWPVAFGLWWEARGDVVAEGEEKDEEKEKRGGAAAPMGSWWGEDGGRCPLTGPRVYAAVGVIIGVLGYFGSGLREWMTDSRESFRTEYTPEGYMSMAFLVLSVRHVAGMLGAALCCRRRAAKAAASYTAMGVAPLALFTAHQRDSFPCQLQGSYTYLSPPPIEHEPCGVWPAQEFAARPIGAYYAPVAARVAIAASVGPLRGGALAPVFWCNATLALAPPPAQAVSFHKYLASGARLALTPPSLCAAAAAAAAALPSALRAEDGYGAAGALHAWVGFRAPTAAGANNSRVTVQLLAGAAGLPAPPSRWEENAAPPRAAGAGAAILEGGGGRFTLSEGGDGNPFAGGPDTAAGACGGEGDGGGAASWPLAAVGGLVGGLQLPLGTFAGEEWAWRVEPFSRVSIEFAGLDMCAEKELS
jgi:hypothetical protein